MSLEEHKRRDRVAEIGLFRYQLICPGLEEGLSTKQRSKLVREIAAGNHTEPFGNQVRISRETLDRWIRRYRAGGFEALAPAPRRPAARTDAQVLELAASLKRETRPAAAQVARILRIATGWAALGVRPAAPFSPTGVDGPGRRPGPGGVRPVRGRRPQRAVGRRRTARPAGGRPQDLPIRFS